MPRCPECSKVVLGASWLQPYFRTWSSGPELVRSADSGCDLCSLVRREIEKVSAANLRRIDNKFPTVLRNYDSEIVLGGDKVYSYGPTSSFSCYLNIGSRPRCHQDPTLEPPYDPVLRAHGLLEACMLGNKDKHDLCKPSGVDSSVNASSLPRRLLDLSHGDVVLTLDTQEWIASNRATVDDLSKYCTLSYRWGQGPPACMLRTQLTTDRITFLVSMPQTFQDAITVVRGLGIRFLWIDDLCIIQPSAHGDYTDWNMEGPRMWLVYQNAICTIAATCSEQPKDGFLHRVGIDYNPPCTIPQADIQGRTREPLFIFTAVNLWYTSVSASNLNRRGWVAQERLLSRRILYFTEEGVFWGCQASESDIGARRVIEHLRTYQAIGPHHHASLMIFGDWLYFIELYSMSRFTLQTDRLIALSSIAKCVSMERFGHEYYAGMWGSHLLRCLSWSSNTPSFAKIREPFLAIAPSWSWASVPGGIQYPTRDEGPHSEALTKKIEVQTILAEASNRYGNMNKGALKLRALLCSIFLPTTGGDVLLADKPAFSDLADVGGWLTWDEYQDPSRATELYTVIPLGIYIDKDRATYDALVITLVLSTDDRDTGNSCEVYQRIGHIYWRIEKSCRIQPEDFRSKLPKWTDALFSDPTEQTIVII